jgi:hypothetical protein
VLLLTLLKGISCFFATLHLSLDHSSSLSINNHHNHNSLSCHLLVCRGKAFAGVEKILGANQLGPLSTFSVRNRNSKIRITSHHITYYHTFSVESQGCWFIAVTRVIDPPGNVTVFRTETPWVSQPSFDG